jgi:hypothetical protein
MSIECFQPPDVLQNRSVEFRELWRAARRHTLLSYAKYYYVSRSVRRERARGELVGVFSGSDSLVLGGFWKLAPSLRQP